MKPQMQINVVFPREFIPDFFYLLYWKLRDFNCLTSSNYVYQDASKDIHEFRYEICAVLTTEKLGIDLSKYEGTFVTLILTFDTTTEDRYKINIGFGELGIEQGALPKKTPWRRELIRLNRIQIHMWLKSGLQKMIQIDDLSKEQIQLVFSNVENAILETEKLIAKGPTTEYHTALFFNSHKDFCDYYYRINQYILLPAHSKSDVIKDNHICILKTSKEFTSRSSERKNYYELSIIGMLLGLISNRHFSVCEYAPKQSQEELGIPNIQPYVEITSKSKLPVLLHSYPEGEFKPLSSDEFRYNNIRLPDDTIEIFNKYDGFPPEKKIIFEDSLCCYQLSLDLKEKFPTFSLVSLLSAMDVMAHLDIRKIEQPAKCHLCGHVYNPICPKCGKEYTLEASRWKYIFEFIKNTVSITPNEENELKNILEDSYYRMRSAAVHNAKLRGLEYDTDEKFRFYLPVDKHFEPSYFTVDYYYRSLKQIFSYTLIEWLKNQ